MDRTNNYLDAIESNDGCLDFNMVMCVLRAQRKDTYAAIKKKLCVQQGVSSQVSICSHTSYLCFGIWLVFRS